MKKYTLIIFLFFFLGLGLFFYWLQNTDTSKIKNEIRNTYSETKEIIRTELEEAGIILGTGTISPEDTSTISTPSTTSPATILTSPTNRNLSGNTKNTSFSSSKRALTKTLYSGALLKQETFYCGCDFNSEKEVNVKGCAYLPKNKKYTRRDNHVEWEHVVPVSWYSSYFDAWEHPENYRECRERKLRGRACAEKIDENFSYLQADMYNLQPAIGVINLDRGNKPYGIISGEKYSYGTCNYESNRHTVEPREEVMGDIARTILYMTSAYDYDISSNYNMEQILEWDKKDPVSQEECRRYQMIKKIQGNENIILKDRCQAL